MSETLPEGVSLKDFNELKDAVTALSDAFKAQKEAETSREKQAAREDVQEAKADLDQLAKELGVSPAKLREAADNAKREEEKERLRPLLLELLDEEIADNPDDDCDDNPAKADDPPEDAPTPTPAPPEDTAPEQEHWSERAIGGIFK